MGPDDTAPRPVMCTLDDQGCLTCTDAGIPVRVLALEGDDACCEDAAGNRALIAMELVAPVQPGEVVLVHGGVAIGRADAGALARWTRRGAAREEDAR